jgi:hypothetical protein
MCDACTDAMRAPQNRAMPLKAKQSPAVVRQREKDGEPGRVLKIPTRLVGAQALRREQSSVTSHKRPDLSYDATIESPYKRVKRSEAASQENSEVSFMPISLSLGPLASGMVGPQRSSSRAPIGPQAQAAAPDMGGQEKPHANKATNKFLTELRAKLHKRQEAAEEQRKSVTVIGGLLKSALYTASMSSCSRVCKYSVLPLCRFVLVGGCACARAGGGHRDIRDADSFVCVCV